MKKLFCFFGKHRYLPRQTFTVTIVDPTDSEKVNGYAECFRGDQCINCGDRKIINMKKQNGYEHKDLTQQAYDWVHDKDNNYTNPKPRKTKPNPGIKLVK